MSIFFIFVTKREKEHAVSIQEREWNVISSRHLTSFSNWQFYFIWNCKGKPIIFRRSLFCFQCLILTSSLSSIRNSYFKFKLDSFELKFSPSFVVLVMMIVNSYSRWRIAWMLLGMSNFSNFSCWFLNPN